MGYRKFSLVQSSLTKQKFYMHAWGFKLTLAGFLMFSLTNCATIVRGSEQAYSAASEPSGARVLLNGEDVGQTPTVVSLKRGRNNQLVFSYEGYDYVTVNLERRFDAGVTIFGNLFSFSLLGMIVDVANGSAYSLTPGYKFAGSRDELTVTVERLGRQKSSPDPELDSAEGPVAGARVPASEYQAVYRGIEYKISKCGFQENSRTTCIQYLLIDDGQRVVNTLQLRTDSMQLAEEEVKRIIDARVDS